jgi:large subunit ribosomal protein L4
MSLALDPTQVSKLPHKVIQMGMRAALSARVEENRGGLDWHGVKTKHMAQRLDEMWWT